MGIYPLTPGHPSYVLTSPEFDSVKIALRNGKTLQISARNNSPRNVYVGARTVNGKAWTKTWISHADLMGGAKIVDSMSSQPNVRAVKPQELPYSAKMEMAGAK